MSKEAVPEADAEGDVEAATEIEESVLRVESKARS